jgi:hypothetical protein
MSRKYTGWDADAPGKRAGFERLVKLLCDNFGLWNNGTWGVRTMRGKQNPSVHGTGRAGDLSWRQMKNKGSGNYQDAIRMMDFLVENADILGVEAVFDYYPAPWGRGWKCDRGAWQVYDKKAFSGSPGGDWVHVEISNQFADDPAHYDRVFAQLLGAVPTPAPAPAPAPAAGVPYPGQPVRNGSRNEAARLVQEKVGAKADGWFGPSTERRVKAWQSAHGLLADGIVGPKTWAAMFG